MYDIALIYDTETTGLPKLRTNIADDSQPSMIQLAAGLYATEKGKDDWKLEGMIYCLCPSDKESEKGALDVHGISKKKTNFLGVSAENALYVFAEMCDIADYIVAHNEKFDNFMIRRALHELDYPFDPFDGNEEKCYCTMEHAKKIVEAKNKAGNIKNPSLEECMKFFFNSTVGENAHDAKADIDACAQVFFELMKRKK